MKKPIPPVKPIPPKYPSATLPIYKNILTFAEDLNYFPDGKLNFYELVTVFNQTFDTEYHVDDFFFTIFEGNSWEGPKVTANDIEASDEPNPNFQSELKEYDKLQDIYQKEHEEYELEYDEYLKLLKIFNDSSKVKKLQQLEKQQEKINKQIEELKNEA